MVEPVVDALGNTYDKAAIKDLMKEHQYHALPGRLRPKTNYEVGFCMSLAIKTARPLSRW